jgi:tRNA(Ile)-lysidine synthase
MPRKPQHSPDFLTVQRTFLAVCNKLPELGKKRRLLLSCSAGGDSMALLDLCACAAVERSWSLAIIHIDHGQRAESCGEAEFVTQQAGGRGLEFFIRRLSPQGRLSEDAMRQERLRIWREVAAEWEADAILVAHQADDQAETILMRLLSGCGPTGLTGILPVQSQNGIAIVRPLLSMRRSALRQYLRERDLCWHDDASNNDPNYKRNWIRHIILPQITEYLLYDPTTHLTSAAELIGAESLALNQATEFLLDALERNEAGPIDANGLNLEHAIWLKAHPALRRQLLRGWLLRQFGGYPPGQATVEQLLEFCERPKKNQKLRSIQGREIVILEGRLLLVPVQKS